jgi:hypothetical protein
MHKRLVTPAQHHTPTLTVRVTQVRLCPHAQKKVSLCPRAGQIKPLPKEQDSEPKSDAGQIKPSPKVQDSEPKSDANPSHKKSDPAKSD